LERLPNFLLAQETVYPNGTAAAAVGAALIPMLAFFQVAAVDGQHNSSF
jgi:hypothetical protein